nr:PaaI family thioesterase [Alphaproteobacteria bacterium]
ALRPLPDAPHRAARRAYSRGGEASSNDPVWSEKALSTVHGGYAATLLDSALGCAVHATLPAGEAYTTLEIKVNYVRAISPRTGPVQAIGEVVHTARRIATAEARLVGVDDGKLYAHGTTTCLKFPVSDVS